MSETQGKAIALFTAKAPRKDLDTEAQQAILRSCAHKSHLRIIAFVAIRQASPERLFQALHLCKSYKAQRLIVDAMDTLFMPVQPMMSFIDFLSENKIDLIDASTGAFFQGPHLESLRRLLETSAAALKAFRGKSIKKSLRLKKREGVKLGARKYGESHDEKEVVKQVVELYDAGLSLQKICTILGSTDIQSVRHKKWHPTTIKRIIERQKKLRA